MNEALIIITGILGATLTYYVSVPLKQGPVRASGVLSLLVGLFFYFCPEIVNNYLTANVPIVFLGTSFIGMITLKMRYSNFKLALAGSLFSLIYIHKNNFFDGYGGTVGMLALLSLLVIMVFFGTIPSLFKQGKK